MIPLLAKLLYYNSLTPFGQQVLDGTANLHNLDISHHTRLLLHHQKAPKPMPFKEMMKGFQKWPECTSTSPSGCHLGIYKLLLKDLHSDHRTKSTKSTGTSNEQVNPLFDPCYQLCMLPRQIYQVP